MNKSKFESIFNFNMRSGATPIDMQEALAATAKLVNRYNSYVEAIALAVLNVFDSYPGRQFKMIDLERLVLKKMHSSNVIMTSDNVCRYMRTHIYVNASDNGLYSIKRTIPVKVRKRDSTES